MFVQVVDVLMCMGCIYVCVNDSVCVCPHVRMCICVGMSASL